MWMSGRARHTLEAMGIVRVISLAIALRSASLPAGSPWTISADGRTDDAFRIILPGLL